jgi:hypothetical protein
VKEEQKWILQNGFDFLPKCSLLSMRIADSDMKAVSAPSFIGSNSKFRVNSGTYFLINIRLTVAYKDGGTVYSVGCWMSSEIVSGQPSFWNRITNENRVIRDYSTPVIRNAMTCGCSDIHAELRPLRAWFFSLKFI